MRKYVFFVAMTVCSAMPITADARSTHRRAAHCPAGQMYRPSIGVCESKAAHRQTMRAAGRFEHPSRRQLREMAHWERRHHVREERQAVLKIREDHSSRLLPTRPYVKKDYVESEAEVQAAEAAMMPETTGSLASTVSPQPQVSFSGIPWTDSGPMSLSPLPRSPSRTDLDGRG